jgi:hypothetical protein
VSDLAEMSTYDLTVHVRELTRAGKTGTAEYKAARAEFDRRPLEERSDALDASDVVFGTVPLPRRNRP